MRLESWCQGVSRPYFQSLGLEDEDEDVLRKVNESKNMLNVIPQRKHKWIGHVLRHDEFLQKFLKEE